MSESAKSTWADDAIAAATLTLKVVQNIALAGNVPYLEGLAGIAILIIDTAQAARCNKEDAAEFAKHISELAQGISMGWQRSSDARRKNLDLQVRELTKTLEIIQKDLRIVTQRRYAKRLLYHSDDRDTLIRCRERLRDGELKFSTLALIEIWQSSVAPEIETKHSKMLVEPTQSNSIQPMIDHRHANSLPTLTKIEGVYNIIPAVTAEKHLTCVDATSLIQAWRAGFYGTNGVHDWQISPNPGSSEFHIIKHIDSDRYISVQSPPGAFGVYLTLSGSPYNWTLRPAPDGNFFLQSTTGAWVADLYSNHRDIGLWTFHGGTNQQWTLKAVVDVPQGVARLVTGTRSISLSSSSVSPTVNDVTAPIARIEKGTYHLHSAVHRSRVMTAAPRDFVRLLLENIDGIQGFEIAANVDKPGFYTIKHMKTDKYLSVQDPPGTMGMFITLSNDSYNWVFELAPDGNYFIHNSSGDWVIDHFGVHADIGLWEFNGGSNQQWRLESLPPAAVLQDRDAQSNENPFNIPSFSEGVYRIFSISRTNGVIKCLKNGFYAVEVPGSGEDQEFTVAPRLELPGAHTMQSRKTGLYISMQTPPGAHGMHLYQSRIPHEWIFERSYDGNLVIWNTTNQWTIDLFGGDSDVGLWEYNGGNNQRWCLEPVYK